MCEVEGLDDKSGHKDAVGPGKDPALLFDDIDDKAA
jgi:hypothetical protein